MLLATISFVLLGSPAPVASWLGESSSSPMEGGWSLELTTHPEVKNNAVDIAIILGPILLGWFFDGEIL